MNRLVVLAGPQAAGKSTVLAKLGTQPQNVWPLFPRGKAPLLFPLQESRQIIAHKYMLLGAIFMTPEQEREVVDCDLGRMDMILQRGHEEIVYLDECNVFTLVHAAAHGVTEMKQYWDAYILRLRQLGVIVVFIDVPAAVSWERRWHRYEQRLIYFPEDQRDAVRQKYCTYLETLRPMLLDFYVTLPFPKIVIDGTSPEDNVLRLVCQQIAVLSG